MDNIVFWRAYAVAGPRFWRYLASMPTFEETKVGYLNLWNKMEVEKLAAANAIVVRILKDKPRYQEVESSTGVPWFVVAARHYRESNLDFNTYLGNGDPLDRPTVHVPIGRGPFASFEQGAADALTHESLIREWPIERILYQDEVFNGLGYYGKDVNSPYLWSYSNLYTSGKYVGDHEFSPSAQDAQCGTAVIYRQLMVADSTVEAALGPHDPLPPQRLPPSTTGSIDMFGVIGMLFSAIFNSGLTLADVELVINDAMAVVALVNQGKYVDAFQALEAEFQKDLPVFEKVAGVVFPGFAAPHLLGAVITNVAPK